MANFTKKCGLYNFNTQAGCGNRSEHGNYCTHHNTCDFQKLYLNLSIEINMDVHKSKPMDSDHITNIMKSIQSEYVAGITAN